MGVGRCSLVYGASSSEVSLASEGPEQPSSSSSSGGVLLLQHRGFSYIAADFRGCFGLVQWWGCLEMLLHSVGSSTLQ